MRSGQRMGMAQSQRKAVSNPAMLRVWTRTIKVWRRRLRGILRGAQRMLEKLDAAVV
jgi:hypothetical protein